MAAAHKCGRLHVLLNELADSVNSICYGRHGPSHLQIRCQCPCKIIFRNDGRPQEILFPTSIACKANA